MAKVHRRKEAIKEVKRLFEAEEWEELSRALLPHVVVDKALDLAEFWWRVRVLCPQSVYVLNIFLQLNPKINILLRCGISTGFLCSFELSLL